MYFWKTKQLASDIKENRFSDNDWKQYYLTVTIIFTIGLYLSSLGPRENLLIVLIEAIIVIGITIVGINITYKTNQQNGGSNYVARVISLSLPISIKFFLASIIFGIIMAIFIEARGLSEDYFEWSLLIFSIVLQLIFYWRINVYLKFINS